MNRAPARTTIALSLVALASLIAFASAMSAPDWGTPVNVESLPGTSADLNTKALEGCPFEAPDGLALYFASDRAGGQGGIDLWVARRASLTAPWGAPANLGAPVNSSADDFCPTPVGDGRLFFVSGRAGGCGGVDVYVTSPAGSGWAEPKNLGCKVNSAATDVTPSLFEERKGDILLYFSSNRAGGSAPEAEGAAADFDVYFSLLQADGSFGPAQLVPGLNTTFNDFRPNVRLDGLEVVFDSNRPGGQGGVDLWVATRKTVNYGWSEPVNLGPTINTSSNEVRGAFSAKGDRLYFGSNRPGGEGDSDIYVSVRGGAVQAAPAVGAPSTGDGGLAAPQAASPPSWAYGAAALVTIGLGAATLRLVQRRARS